MGLDAVFGGLVYILTDLVELVNFGLGKPKEALNVKVIIGAASLNRPA